MGLRINSLDKIKKHLKIQEGGPAHARFTELCYEKMDQFVPYHNGDLSTNVDLQTDLITYETVYASYQFFGKRKDDSHEINENNRDRSKHPLATSRWDKKMISIYKKEIVKEVNNYVKAHGGGR